MDFNGRMTLDKVLYLSFSQKIPLCIDIKSLFLYIDKKLQKKWFFVHKYRYENKILIYRCIITILHRYGRF